MFTLLAAYLESIVTPERKRIYLNACEALVAVGMTEHEIAIEQEILMADTGGTDLFLSALENLLLPMIRQVIGEMGVVLQDAVTLQQATDILTALHSIDNYDDPDSINGLCDAPEGATVALAEILPLLGAYTASDYLTFLDTVSEDTLARIDQLTRTEVVEALPSPLHVERARLRLTPFARKFTDALILQALGNGARLALHVSDLISPYRDQIEALAPEAAARELYGFALASNADNLDTVLSEELELLYSDPKQATPVDVQLAKLKKEFPSA